MYYYLVDSSQFDGKNFEFYQTQLLSLLGEYHISGEVARVTRLRTVEDLVLTALSHGVTTLVVAGGDETFDKVVAVCRGKAVTLGFIPLNSQSQTARILGVGDLLDSVVTIAKRRVENLDLACVGQTYFVSNISFESGQAAGEKTQTQAGNFFSGLRSFFTASSLPEVEIRFDRSYTARGNLFLGSIINARDHVSQKEGVVLGNPKDGLLDVVLVGGLSRFERWQYRKPGTRRSPEAMPGASVVHAREIEILGPAGLNLLNGAKVVAEAPARIFVSPDKIRAIVGKNRTF